MTAVMLPLIAATFVSCSKDTDDYSKVDVTLDIDESTAKVVGKDIYVVKAKDAKIHLKDITVKDLETGKAGLVDRVVYYWDYTELGYKASAPFEFNFPVENATIDKHEIEITCRVLVEGKSIAAGLIKTTVHVVEKEEDIPTPNADNTITSTVQLAAE